MVYGFGRLAGGPAGFEGTERREHILLLVGEEERNGAPLTPFGLKLAVYFIFEIVVIREAGGFYADKTGGRNNVEDFPLAFYAVVAGAGKTVSRKGRLGEGEGNAIGEQVGH